MISTKQNLFIIKIEGLCITFKTFHYLNVMEIFKTVPGFPDYEVSNCGRARTKSRLVRYTHAVTGNEHFRKTEHRFLKHHINGGGYKFYQLYLNKKFKNKTAHRLVAETFIPNPHGFRCVNHKDGNKHNNTVENLEWCTDEYNHQHATTTGLMAKGSRVATSKLNESSARAIKFLLKEGRSHPEIANMFNVSRTTITLINTGVTWKHINL